MYDFLLVGTGLFNAVFAYEAHKKGKKCIAVEKRDHIGGNCYTEEINGINVHKYGAHIFRTSDKFIWNYIQQFAEFNKFINSPIANYHGEIYNLPFNMNTFSKMWGIRTPEEAKRIIDRQRKQITGEATNLEEHAISLVGTDVYEKLIKGYTEKQWGRPCSELPKSIMRRIPVRYTYDNNYYNDFYQGIPVGGYTCISFLNKL
jgi:UDP-galactopyranose mutase